MLCALRHQCTTPLDSAGRTFIPNFAESAETKKMPDQSSRSSIRHPKRISHLYGTFSGCKGTTGQGKPKNMMRRSNLSAGFRPKEKRSKRPEAGETQRLVLFSLGLSRMTALLVCSRSRDWM